MRGSCRRHRRCRRRPSRCNRRRWTAPGPVSRKPDFEQLRTAVEQERNREAEAILKALAKRKTTTEQAAIIEELAKNVVTEAAAMSGQLARYRVGYKVSITASGSKSLSNGDEVATFLQMKTPEEVCRIADYVCDQPLGWHEAKYESLNPGQKRMNAGNKIRARVKKGEITIDEIKAA